MGHVHNLESNLNEVNGRFVNIDKDRMKFTEHYNKLRNALYSIWKNDKNVLAKLLKGHSLEGSYGDNLKVQNPDEFDLVIHLVFPENDYIIVKPDPQRPGNVTLDMTQVMDRIRNQDHNKEIYLQLQKIVNAKNMLLENKLQSWLQSEVTLALRKMNFQIEVNGVISDLVYKRSGPAHTMYVTKPCEYSVDFVPSIRLCSKQIVLGPMQKQHFGKTEFWNAIPKPIKGLQGDNISFRASFFLAEHELLKDKQNLKNAVRLMKMFRDSKQNMGNLKSYYIKTLFLWQVTEQPASYWMKPINIILTDMFGRLVNSLSSGKKNGKLLFFWDPNLDMLADLTDNQRRDMFSCALSAGECQLKMCSGNLNEINKNNVVTAFSNQKDCSSVDKQSKKQETSPNPQSPNTQESKASGQTKKTQNNELTSKSKTTTDQAAKKEKPAKTTAEGSEKQESKPSAQAKKTQNNEPTSKTKTTTDQAAKKEKPAKTTAEGSEKQESKPSAQAKKNQNNEPTSKSKTTTDQAAQKKKPVENKVKPPSNTSKAQDSKPSGQNKTVENNSKAATPQTPPESAKPVASKPQPSKGQTENTSQCLLS